jgi:cysteine-rich repeat protein
MFASIACTDDTTVVESGSDTATDGEGSSGDGDPGDGDPGDGDGDPGDGDGDGDPAAKCGNGVVEAGEACDDGNVDNTDHCLDTCEAASCGDGYIGPGEGCDDGNGVDDDMCSNECALASCGDGEVQIGEDCDDANDNDSDDCLSTCIPASCGDGHVWAGIESCDDGNGDSTDACPETCENAICGDGYAWAGNEACDDGNADSTDDCTEVCEPAECGDGYVWLGNEECDDANDDNTDNCVDGCLDAQCGDGFLGPGEGCDDGNGLDDACTNACALATCGDGIVHPGEACDDGDADNTDYCLDTCATASCGDGHTWANNEECDDGNGDNTDACPTTCEAAYCGDGFEYLNTEECDDANGDELDACSSNCIDASCGDGFLWLGQEECDDANNVANDGCSMNCLIEPHPPNPWTFRTHSWGGRTDYRFRTIANLADDDIWFLGEGAIHFDGSWFTSYAIPFGQPMFMLDSAVSPEGDIWATDSQKMYHYDGSGWATIEFDGVYTTRGVWRSPTGVIWIGADDGIILRSTIINTWEEVPCPVGHDISSLWGTDDDNIWAATAEGTILRWDGNAWNVENDVVQGFIRIRGLDANNIHVVTSSSTQREWNGQIWKNVAGLGVSYYDIWWPSPDKRCTVGGNANTDEGYMSCYDGVSWQHIKPSSASQWIDTMTEISDGRRIITDEEGGIQTLSQQSGYINNVPLSDQYWLGIGRGVWHRADNDIWALGGGSPTDIVRYDGTDWTEIQELPVASYRMDGFGNTGWIAGPIGAMYRFDGNGWVMENVPAATIQVQTMEIFAEGEGWAVMSSGIAHGLLRLQGNVWAAAALPNGFGVIPNDMYATAADNAYLTATNRRLYHWDGLIWTLVPGLPATDNNNGTYTYIDGSGPDNIWIVGNDDTVIHWDGVGWTEHDISPNPLNLEDLTVLEVDQDGDVWTRSYNDDAFFRHHQGQWSIFYTPFLETSYVTTRASNNSRWWLGSRILEIRH